jgi:MSHA pilin protein MshD
VGLTGILAAFQGVTRSSSDPVVHKQLIAVAQALMEEITLKPFAVAAHAAPAGCARDTFNDVRDYNGYSSNGVCTVDGVAIAALAGIRVRASVAAGTLGGVAGALKITVTVTQGGQSLTLVGWRTDYAS